MGWTMLLTYPLMVGIQEISGALDERPATGSRAISVGTIQIGFYNRS
jgi:hypothetical protein